MVVEVKAGSPLLLSCLRVGDVVSKVGGAYLLAKGNQNGIDVLVQLMSASTGQVVLQVERKWESLDDY
jgi:C-terminal processing protease CtpA/Prc